MAELHDDVDRIRAQRAENDHPMARAASALADLDHEQQAQILDANYISAVERLQLEQNAAEKLRLLAVNDVNRVRLLVATFASDGSLSSEMKEKLESLLAQLPPLRNS